MPRWGDPSMAELLTSDGNRFDRNGRDYDVEAAGPQGGRRPARYGAGGTITVRLPYHRVPLVVLRDADRDDANPVVRRFDLK